MKSLTSSLIVSIIYSCCVFIATDELRHFIERKNVKTRYLQLFLANRLMSTPDRVISRNPRLDSLGIKKKKKKF